MKDYFLTLSKTDRAMATSVVRHYGGEARFIADRDLVLTIDSFELLRDSRFNNDALVKFYEKNKEKSLLYALSCVSAGGYHGIGDMVKAQYPTGVLSTFTPHSFSDALYDKNSKNHTKIVGHLMRYLMQQVVSSYSKSIAK